MEGLLIILKNSPYRTELSKLSLDLAMTFATFEQKVSILIIGDGCLQLYPYQNTENFVHRNHFKTLMSLKFYGIENIYIESESVNLTGLDFSELAGYFKIISNDSAKKMIAKSRHVIGS